MKDPHIHIEKGWLYTGFGIMRDLIASVGLAAASPKTVGTGCNRRRPLAMTSTKPESVTCLPCVEYAVSALDEHLAMTQVALTLPNVSDEDREKMQRSLDVCEDAVTIFRSRLPVSD